MPSLTFQVFKLILIFDFILLRTYATCLLLFYLFAVLIICIFLVELSYEQRLSTVEKERATCLLLFYCFALLYFSDER